LPERTGRHTRARLLVVDDTEANRYSVARHLRANGFVVREATTGQAGLDLAFAELPDLVVLDIRLPDMSGLEVARVLRTDERTADIPLLHISASFTDPASRAKGLDNGADGYLTHPVDPLVMLATIRSLLRAREAERRLQATAADWSATFDAIAEGVCITAQDGRVTRCNRSFRELVGAGDGTVSRSICELIPGIEVRPEQPFIALPGGGDVARLEVGDRWLRVSAVPVAAEGGQATGAVCVVTDVTRERRADERMRQALQLESTGRLAGGVAHEINNMMTAILAYAEFALRGMAPDDPKRADIMGIHRAATRSADVARQLLTFSRRQVVRPRVVDVHALVRESERMVRRLLGADRTLKLELGARDPWVAVDPLGLDQILINLALNARDAMPHGGELQIRTSNVRLDDGTARRHPEIVIRQGPYIQIEVTDNGFGMDAETLDRIFEPFFTTKEVGQGTGLGLPTVYGMVKQSDGYIWAESEPGRGSVFTVQLPQVPPAAPAPAEPAAESRSLTGTILLVEDEPVVRTLLRRTLGQAGYGVEEAADGGAAIAVMERLEGKVLAVLSDVIMPRVGGRELAAEIRAQWPSVPILFMSGYTNDEVIGRGLIGANEAFLQKPFGPEALDAALRNLMTRAVLAGK
jgi:two-component system, cell cycle sensor histidine kinase and response regulator CckA